MTTTTRTLQLSGATTEGVDPDYRAEFQLSWDHLFLNFALEVSRRSRDPSTQVGAVIATDDNLIISVGYNGFPRGVHNTKERWETRPDKYDYVVHAERNAILNAARIGRATEGCKMYLVYEKPPCTQCMLDVINAGIAELVLGPVPFGGVGNGKHYDTDGAGYLMLQESGILVTRVTDWVPRNFAKENFGG